MSVRTNPLLYALLVMSLTFSVAGSVKKSAEPVANNGPAVLWRDPSDIASRDLFYGPGGAERQPHGPFTFEKEDLDGTNPKFVVRDADGMKWKVKLGVEARPETVATRLVWAVGYSANEDYFLPDLRVENMPARLHRGQKLIAPDGSVPNVRLKREDEKKIGNWQWRDDPFAGTREWNGLRVMMAVLNNWDLKDENNSVYRDKEAGQIYIVSDLGASLGTSGASWPLSKAKGNLRSYTHSKFIRGYTATTVDFYVPARPEFLYLLHPHDYFQRLPMRWIGRGIPRADARWIGDLLARLSSRQIQDAFRAAGYSAAEVEGFSRIVEGRIALLTEL
ncbi:MAG TPA: hypothetical protein VKR61_10535 [Bryobacteraceae bacterium]|nr:hypothetical protein [Bryobacteraceae bacterium]